MALKSNLELYNLSRKNETDEAYYALAMDFNLKCDIARTCLSFLNHKDFIYSYDKSADSWYRTNPLEERFWFDFSFSVWLMSSDNVYWARDHRMDVMGIITQILVELGYEVRGPEMVMSGSTITYTARVSRV